MTALRLSVTRGALTAPASRSEPVNSSSTGVAQTQYMGTSLMRADTPCLEVRLSFAVHLVYLFLLGHSLLPFRNDTRCCSFVVSLPSSSFKTCYSLKCTAGREGRQSDKQATGVGSYFLFLSWNQPSAATFGGAISHRWKPQIAFGFLGAGYSLESSTRFLSMYGAMTYLL